MPASSSFGRRQAPAPPPVRAAPRPAPPAASSLSAEAEAFRAQLAGSSADRTSPLDDWRRSRRGRQIAVWVVTLASLAIGPVSFELETPLSVSIVLEVAAIAANIWLRRERRNRLREIVALDDPADA